MSNMATRALRRPLIVIAALCVAFAGCGSDGSGASGAPGSTPGSSGTPGSSDEIQFLEPKSMLFQAAQQALSVSGERDQWRHHFEDPLPQDAVRTASVWLLHYPGAVIPEPGKSVIATWADPAFWDALRNIGIELLHTNPVERAGGIQNGQYTPTIDGWFDRISMEIDPQLGSEQEYRDMVRVAGDRSGSIGGDLVPLHTGLGADFRLATLAYKDYPSVYTMVEIRQEDWGLLPAVGDPSATALVSKETGATLVNKGYIPGIINPADANPAVKASAGWSATAEIVGVDGKTRRWVYLHVFKPQQPALNWSDPAYGGRRVTIGDAVRNIHDLGNRVVRLDAVPFLGIDPKPGDVMATNFITPLSIMGANDIAFTVRKFGGFTFEELNVPIDQLKDFTKNGPDLTYDFFTRAEAIHPVLTGDVRPLRLEHQQLLQKGFSHGALIHDLQNHDEITYQLVNLGSLGDVQLDGETLNGAQLKQQILQQMRAGVEGDAAPFNKLYRTEQDGIATTFAGFIAPALGIKDPYHATADQVAMIRRGHLLLATANAMQPGVFGISSWDLVGALPVPEQAVADRITDADFRWVNRGAVDLIGANPGADKSVIGLPRATTLYGTLPDQLKSPDSFASQLKKMLAARKKFRVAESNMIAVPSVGDNAVCVLVMVLPDNGGLAVTALNYARESKNITVDLSKLPSNSVTQGQAHDLVADQDVGTVSGGQLKISLDALTGRTIGVK
jgi:maltose alpha-D-glucosyltransferase/alpha-amylase